MNKYAIDINSAKTGERVNTLLITCDAEDIAGRIRTLEAHYGADCKVRAEFVGFCATPESKPCSRTMLSTYSYGSVLRLHDSETDTLIMEVISTGQPAEGLAVVPALDHDAMMAARWGHKVSAQGRLERRIVANLIAHLARAGFEVRGVNDGMNDETVSDAKSAMELIFNLDESRVYFKKPRCPSHIVVLITGNGTDIVSDWTFTEGDRDGFDAAMDAFNAETFA